MDLGEVMTEEWHACSSLSSSTFPSVTMFPSQVQTVAHKMRMVGPRRKMLCCFCCQVLGRHAGFLFCGCHETASKAMLHQAWLDHGGHHPCLLPGNTCSGNVHGTKRTNDHPRPLLFQVGKRRCFPQRVSPVGVVNVSKLLLQPSRGYYTHFTLSI